MFLQDIKEQLSNASPADLVNLAIEFERGLLKLCEFHEDYVHFYQEYGPDRYLKANREYQFISIFRIGGAWKWWVSLQIRNREPETFSDD